MGGIGKTVLASAVVRDDEVRRSFPDGIYWLTLGQHANAVAQQIQLAHEISKQSETFLNLYSGKTRLEELLRNRRSLIVLDDVWSIPDACAFDLSGTAARLLLTTRYERVTEAVHATEIKVPKLSTDLALDMLSAFSGQPRDTLPVEAVGLVEKAGGLPLALAMTGRLAQDKPKAWVSVLGRFEGARIAAPIGREDEFPYESVSSAIEASVEVLSATARELFLDLAVFPEDAPIPLSVLEIFWAHRGLDTFGVAEHAEDFVARSLASWNEEEEGAALKDQLILHDLVGGYLRGRATDLAARHKQLIDAYRHVSGKWADLPLNQLYIWNWLSFHLVEAGCGEELKALLLDTVWIEAKLTATNVQRVLADYDKIVNDDDLQLVRHALAMSAHILACDKTQLAGQLIGRLLETKRPLVQSLLRSIRESTSGLRLCPTTVSVSVAGGALLRTFEGHQGEINAVAVLADGRRALSGSSDRTIKLWDLELGKVRRILKDERYGDDPVNAVAALPDGRHALSASYSTLKLWDLERGEVLNAFQGRQPWINAFKRRPPRINAFKGHQPWINAMAVLPDGRRALSASADGTLKLWDLERGKGLRTFKDHPGFEVTAVAIMPDGRRALSGSNDHTVKLWDLRTGTLLATFTADSPVSAIGVAGADLFVAGSTDGNVHILRPFT